MLFIGLTTMILTSCQKQDEVTEIPAPEPAYILADLALSLPASSAGTRMSTAVMQADGSFRGIQRLSIIPFSKQGRVTSSDMPSYYEGSDNYVDRYTPELKNSFDERFRYYSTVYLMKGVASFLTYGQSSRLIPAKPDGVSSKAFYGSLIPKVEGLSVTESVIPDRVFPSQLSFELEQIYKDDAIPAEATAIANYMSYIAHAQGTINAGTEEEKTESWQNCEDGWLNLIYMNFTSQGSDESNVIAGSARNVKALVNTLYTYLSSPSLDYRDGSIEKAIIDDIKSRMSSYTYTYDDNKSLTVTFDATVTSLGDCDNYPNDIDLPDGAAALLWIKTEDKFVPQITTTQEVPINAIQRYAYPPELYFYGNSRINTSNESVQSDAYKGKTTWTDVLSLYPNQDATVGVLTKAVAIKDPLQYGVARLSATVQAASASLPDADGTSIHVGAEEKSFPVTGLIVCGQMPVDFEFKPKTTGDEFFIYDSQLSSTSLYLKQSVKSDPIQALVLQSPDSQDVTIMLELENNSGIDFRGEECIVYQGTKFYLLGKVKLSEGSDAGVDESNREDVRKRVFTQDHTTTLTMNVQTLAHAYNVMPNILNERLEIGVDIKLNWVEAKPSTIILGD